MSVMPRTLPAGKLVIGYATSRSLREDRVVAACDDGVNVVIWVERRRLFFLAPLRRSSKKQKKTKKKEKTKIF